MPKFKNISPLGALDIPALGRIVESGEVFDVPDKLVSNFARQSANFERVTRSSKPKTDAPVPEQINDTPEEETR